MHHVVFVQGNTTTFAAFLYETGLFGLCYTWACFRAGPGRVGPAKSPTQKSAAQARPGPTVGPCFSTQAWPIGPKKRRAVGPSGRAFIKSAKSSAQARPD
jgi:hypothetical protein